MSLFKLAQRGQRPYPSDWPPKEYYVEEKAIEEAVKTGFADLLKNGVSETDADFYGNIQR